MKRITYLFTLIAICGFSDAYYPDFILSMTRRGRDFNQIEAIQDWDSVSNLEIYRALYKKNVFSPKGGEEKSRIPKIIHQIWLGSLVPYEYVAWMKSWMGWLGWEYILWTDEEITKLSLYNQELYDRARSYGEKTNILRLEILLHYGGIYADVDFECLNSSYFEEYVANYDFFVGFEPIEHGIINGIPKICNAIIGSSRYHPLLKNLIVNMKPNWVAHENETGVQKSGPDYFSRTILDYEKGILTHPERASDHPDHRNIYFPCTFLYPFSDPEIKKTPSRETLFSEISKETAAIHYWSGSWRSP